MEKEDLQEQIFSMKKVDELVRMGLMPVENLPWLMQALQHMQSDAYLPYMERKVLYEFIRRVFSQVFNDPLMYRLIRQRTAMNKYEEVDPTFNEELNTGPDLKKAPEGMLYSLATQADKKKKAGGTVSDAEKKLASRAKAELRRRKNVAAKAAERKESYLAAFEKTLNEYNINSLSDLSDEDIKDFLNTVEEIFKLNSGE